MNGIIDWLHHTAFGLAPAWTFVAFIGAFVLEWAIGRFFGTKPWARSLLAVLGHALAALLVVTKIGAIPVVGRGLVAFLEKFAGVDLDGDGRIGDDPPAPPGPPSAALVLLGFLALGSSGCAHGGKVVQSFTDCAAPELEAACDEVKPRVLEVLTCSALATEALPGCVLAGLADLGRDHGRQVVDCAVIAIRDAFSVPGAGANEGLARRRAALVIKREEARGVRFVSRPAP